MLLKLLSAALTLFLIMDPIGNIPVFVSYLKNVKEGRRSWVVARECVIALGVLVFFLFFGPTLMQLLAISQASLYISGGVLLFLIAIGMIFPSSSHFGIPTNDEDDDDEPFIVPLAIPLVAGPAEMATIMIFSSQQEPLHFWLIALIAAWSVGTAILMLSPPISRLLGDRGLRACERLMGMVLTVISVQMFLDGISYFMKHHL